MLGWIGVVLSCCPRALSNQSSVLSSGVRFWLCRPCGLGILGIDNLNGVRSIARLLDRGCCSEPFASG